MSNINIHYILIFLCLIFFVFIIISLLRNKKNKDYEIQLETQPVIETVVEVKQKVQPEKPVEWMDLAVTKIEKLKDINDLTALKAKKQELISEVDLLSEINDLGGSGNILVVDDSLVVRKKICSLLNKQDYAYVAQKDGQYAINYLEYLLKNGLQLPDVIITDLEMPNVDGIELISWIRNNTDTHNLPIIVVSSHMNLEKLFSSHNIQGFLSKPFKDDDLINQIDYLLKF